MSDESEESCLVHSKTQSLTGLSVAAGPAAGTTGAMPYTDGRSPTLTGGGGQRDQRDQRDQRSPSPQAHRQPTATTQQGDYARMTAGTQATSGVHRASDAGELIDFNEELVLSQFHTDAMKQAGCGRFQLIAALIAGLGLCGQSIQVYSVFYIMPSAEMEYCIRGSEKSWLANITLLGLGVGALFWGGLAGRTGRRKTLLSCLAVSAVFSVIAAFMPTYGPFMMARFTAAVGIGGAMPAAVAYVCELTPTAWRSRLMAVLGAVSIGGGIVAGSVALLVVPLTGQQVMLENKEHFSAWHQYLLLMTLPTVAAVLGLLWLPESPRYLLECGREVEALAIYQRIYRNNRLHGGWALTEMEMPAVRNQRNTTPASVLAGMAHSINMYWESFAELFGPKHRRETWLMVGAWAAAVFAYHGITVYSVEYSKHLENMVYAGRTGAEFNRSFESVDFNASIENVVFEECHFRNCTFRRVFLNHVLFRNCTFLDTEFTNVKTSGTQFVESVLDDVRLIDTDLHDRHFINCTSNNTAIVRLRGSCDEDFEFNIFVDNLWRANVGSVVASVVAVLLVGELLLRLDKTRVQFVCLLAALGLAVLLAIVREERHVIWVGGCLQGSVYAAMAAMALLAAETYATPLRSSALGLFMCSGHIGALLGASLYATLPLTATAYAATVTIGAVLIPAAAALFLRDACALI